MRASREEGRDHETAEDFGVILGVTALRVTSPWARSGASSRRSRLDREAGQGLW